MPAVEKCTINDWKRLWQMVSGIHFETPENTVSEELLNVKSELLAGLLHFKPKSASNVQLSTLLKEKKQEKLLPFTERLQDLLNLESAQCWEILCYYLTNEYRGSASLLTQLISTETNMIKLLEDIRHYYSLERMIVLKIVKNLLLFYNVRNHPYHNEYRMVVDKLTLPGLRDSYLNQVESLINEIPPGKLLAADCFHPRERLTAWSERNARETTEVVHILLLLSEHLPMGLEQIRRLFAAFKQHSFGRIHNYLDDANPYHKELKNNLCYSESALLLKCLDFENPEKDAQLIEQVVDELRVQLSGLHHRLEHGPLLLVWMLLRLRGTNDAEDASSLLHCRHLGQRAVALKCFSQLQDIVNHIMFADDSLLSRIVRKTIYNQLCYFCDLFDSDGSCAQYEGIFELMCELLSWPQLAKEFCSQDDGGVRSLYKTLLENFPLRFKNLAHLAQALTKAGQGNYIKDQLQNLPILALLYDEREHKLNELGPDEYELTAPVRPFPHIDFTMPAGTDGIVIKHAAGCYVHFRTSVNFFNALHYEINCLLCETAELHGEYESNERIQNVEAGLKYLEVVLQRTKSIDCISSEMVHPTEMCIDLLNKFKSVQYPPTGLISICLNVCSALLPLVDEEIFMRISNLDILPTFSNGSLQNYKQYATSLCFESRFLGSVIDNVEKKQERYDFLLSYLGFLRTYTKLKRNRYMQVEIPGLIFLLRDVFPHLHTWHFKSKFEKNKIYFEVLSFICDILDIIGTSHSDNSATSTHREQQELLRNICVYSLLNLENGLILLRFVGVGNAFVQYSMELETNWMQHQPHGLMMLVRLSMRILMQLLRLKRHVYGDNTLSPMEALIYTQPKQRDSLRIIPIVCSYMSNIFDRWLPILSCRLLKRIATEFNMSLLACLDMEADQIRLTFMQKLPDELESDSIKIAILELVDACIAKQPGVTEAFFKVNYVHDKRSFFGKECTPNIGDSIVTYMQEFLDALKAEPLTIQQLLPCKIMSIFHSLWKHNLQMLVKKLLEQPDFWPKLCTPLFSELQPNMRVYTQLLNIVSIEVYCTGKREKVPLQKVMQKWFEREYFEKWLDYVFDLPQEPKREGNDRDELPDWICRLQSFKDLIVILLKKQPKFIEIPEAQFKLLAQKCLTVLVARANYLEDMRPFIMLSELYIFILLNYKHSYTKDANEENELMEQLLQLMSRICSCYEDLHVRSKEACLAIITKCAQLYTNLLISDSSVSLRFLNSVVSIICTELQSMENSVNLDQQQQGQSPKQKNNLDCNVSTNSLILCLNLLKAVATIFQNDGPANWDLPFVSVRLFQRLLRCISYTLQLHSKQALTIQLLDVLIVFAKSHCSAEFLHCDVGDNLWLNLLPPRELLQSQYEFSKPNEDIWTVEKWWPIYARGIELVTIIFNKHKKCFLQEVLQFVGIHEVYLIDSLLLGKQSLEPDAMQLIKAAISLVTSLTKYDKEWREDHASSLQNIMRAVQGLLCHAMSMFHQQRHLKSLMARRRSQLEILRSTETIIVDDDIIAACNNLTEVIICCVKALQTFSPDLLDLVCSGVYEPYKWEPVLDVMFGAPKLSEDNVSLTLNMVLNMVVIYVKALNMQNHGFNEVPLNTLPAIETTDLTDNTGGPQVHKASYGRHSCSKTLTSSSISTITCPSNELLSNLDGPLCLVALEHLLMLVASQSIYMVRSPDLDPRWKQIVRRDICSELLSFHEFVKRKVIVDYRDTRCPWVRRKHGLRKLKPLDPARGVPTLTTRPTSEVCRSSSTANELRVNVVRRLHLQQQHQRSSQNFEMTHVLSPIGAPQSQATGSAAAISSTPNLSRPPIQHIADESADRASSADGPSTSRTLSLARPAGSVIYEETPRAQSGATARTLSFQEPPPSTSQLPIEQASDQPERKRLYIEQQEGDGTGEIITDIQYYEPPTEPGFCELSQVQLVEEDYLQLMSALFTVIPQNE
ncbi:nucleoporin NUP188 homolog [Scaptodrosophila lebanonensis]|uniref:Nucleoporin NUP188 n=1 Tax=Drosophila lebanonensis TaxID=7225 RepID=A0A6J2TY92_DROLE|nr:nucleoporin NUP188 homolog [Scaptodrosophila lebanonensis]